VPTFNGELALRATRVDETPASTTLTTPPVAPSVGDAPAMVAVAITAAPTFTG
jgi:hypothetical protein